MLSSLAVAQLRSHFTPQNIPVLCLYLNHKKQNSQTPRNLIAALLKQLIQFDNYAYCSPELIDRYEERGFAPILGQAETEAAFCAEMKHYDR